VLEMNDDLRAWMDVHKEQIKKVDIDIFLEYQQKNFLM